MTVGYIYQCTCFIWEFVFFSFIFDSLSTSVRQGGDVSKGFVVHGNLD